MSRQYFYGFLVTVPRMSMAKSDLFWGTAWSMVHPFPPYTPREVSRVLGGETETRSPSPQGCFPAGCDALIPLTILVLRASHRPARKKGGWTPMSDTFAEDFKRRGAFRSVGVLRSPHGTRHPIHGSRRGVIQTLMTTLMVVKGDIRRNRTPRLAGCHIVV